LLQAVQVEVLILQVAVVQVDFVPQLLKLVETL
jgi:hypothetical protein